MKRVVMILVAMLGVGFTVLPVQARCACRCVNGEVKALCTSTLDVPPVCAPQVCPIVPPSIAPIAPLQLPPLGTTECEMGQVFNPRTRQYAWQRVCR